MATGSIAYFGTYRPPVPLNIYASSTKPDSNSKEEAITDGKSYNFNGHMIPEASLNAILDRPELRSFAESNVTSAMAFVSERTNGLETLHIALRIEDDVNGEIKYEVLRFDEIYDEGEFKGVRMEDSPCFSGNYMIYISTKEEATKRRQPWTAVYRTNLETGETVRLTPRGTADLNPAISPDRKKIAVATFEHRPEGWTGEIEHQETTIVVMNLDGSNRRPVVTNGGWPTWGSKDIIFFHRGRELVDEKAEANINKKTLVEKWGVFKADISDVLAVKIQRVTPEDIDAVTPAAIDSETVVVATIREKLGVASIRKIPEQYRHIEVFDTSKPPHDSTRITQSITPMADHYNPFVIGDGIRVGYHRCRGTDLKSGEVSKEFDELESPIENVGLLRVSGVFPTFSSDGKKLAFVDNEFKKIWLADDKGPLRVICSMSGRNKVFCPVWNQNPDIDTLYICTGEAFNFGSEVIIKCIQHASDYGFKGKPQPRLQQLTDSGCNSAFPSTNREGTKLVFRSTRDWVGLDPPAKMKYRNLYMMDSSSGDFLGAEKTRLSKGEWMDSHCQWSPVKGSNLIVFSSTRDKPEGAPALDNGLDPGFYAMFLMCVKDASNPVVVRVIGSRESDVAGHVNHPCFSPDGCRIVFTSDMGANSVDPISLPLFVHSVRPYGDIFSLELNDPNNVENNENIVKVTRITHSRYENSTPSWNAASIERMIHLWKKYLEQTPGGGGGGCPASESWYMTGHLHIEKRCC